MLCSRWNSVAEGCEIVIRHPGPEKSLRRPDRANLFSEWRNNSRYRRSNDRSPPTSCHYPAAIEGNVRLRLSAVMTTLANRKIPAFPGVQVRCHQACRESGPKCGSRCVSSVKPLSQAELRDLTLLFGSFAKFGFRVIACPALKNFQHLQRGLTRSANDKDVAKLLFVLAVPLC